MNNKITNSVAKPSKETSSSQGIISDKKFAKDFTKEGNRLKNILEEKKKYATEINGSKRTKKSASFGSKKAMS